MHTVPRKSSEIISHSGMAMTRKIPLVVPDIGEAEKAAVLEVLESGWLVHGTYNRRLEEDFAEFVGVEHAITVNSCTSGLEAILKAYGIRGEVVLPSFTFVATANAVVTSGATPVFCDVDLETRNVRAADIEPCLTSRTEAVTVVHYGGQPCAMDEIRALCDRKGLLLIEDSAETLGATWNGKQAGSFGVGCFSFFPTKNMTTGEGGIVTLDDSEHAAKIRALIAHGIATTTFIREREEKPWFRSAILPGHNFRLTNIQAAIGYHQLKRVDEMNGKRLALARHYDEGIRCLGADIEPPAVAEGATHVYQMYTVRVDPAKRDRWVLRLREAGIGASVHFDPPVHHQEFYRLHYPADRPLENTELLARSLITLPIYPSMAKQDAAHVLDALSKLADGSWMSST